MQFNFVLLRKTRYFFNFREREDGTAGAIMGILNTDESCLRMMHILRPDRGLDLLNGERTSLAVYGKYLNMGE